MNKLFISTISSGLVRKILALCVVVLIASFLGYLVENIWVSLRHGYIDNRGMYLPCLLGYGLANLVIFALFGTPDQPKLYLLQNCVSDSVSEHFLYALEVFVSITVCESAFGHLIYHVCHVKWWNYNSIPLHIGQYTSIPTSIGFTACIYIYIQNIFTPIYTFLLETDIERYGTIILSLTILAIADCVYGLYYMYKHHTVNILFRRKVSLSIPFGWNRYSLHGSSKPS